MPKILFVSMPGVTHSAQWISQLRDSNWDVHFFPSHHGANYLDCLEQLTIYTKEKTAFPKSEAKVRIKSLMPIKGFRLARIAQKVFPGHFDLVKWLARTIDKIQPDVIHSMEMQRGAYLVDSCRKFLKKKMPPWIVTPWGSDLYLYKNLSAHVERLSSVLRNCDFFWAECQRDYQYAAELGFNGTVLSSVPASGGYQTGKLPALETCLPSKRKFILLKGYQGFAGRALNALTAMRGCQKELEGYTIVLYLSCYDVDVAAELFSKSTGIKVKTLQFPRPFDEIQKYFSMSRVHIGLSISDGLPTSVVEAMAMGALPIQSDSSCAHEWIKDGVNGLLVPADDPAAIAVALRRALTDDKLVDEAAQLNREVVIDKFDYEIIQKKVLDTYGNIFLSQRHVAFEEAKVAVPTEVLRTP